MVACRRAPDLKSTVMSYCRVFLIGLLLAAAHVSSVAGPPLEAEFGAIPLPGGGNPEGTAEAVAPDGSLVLGDGDSAGSQLYPYGAGREAWIYGPDAGLSLLGDLAGIPYGLYKSRPVLASRDSGRHFGISFRQEQYLLPWFWDQAGGGLTALGLPPGADRFHPADASASGRTMTGWAGTSDFRQPAFWSEVSGSSFLQVPGGDGKDGEAAAVTPDGVRTAGWVSSPAGDRAFAGELGSPALLPSEGAARAVHLDAAGQNVVGWIESSDGPRAALWRAGKAPELISPLAGDTRSSALRISDDGRLILAISAGPGDTEQLFLASTDTLIPVPLGQLDGGFRYEARSFSPDLSIVAGVVRLLDRPLPFTGFVWDRVRGMRDVRQILDEELGLGKQRAGYELLAINGISADGRLIGGEAGIGPVSEQTPFYIQIRTRGSISLPRRLRGGKSRTAPLTNNSAVPVAVIVDVKTRGLAAPLAHQVYTIFPGETLNVPVQPAPGARSGLLVIREFMPGGATRKLRLKF